MNADRQNSSRSTAVSKTARSFRTRRSAERDLLLMDTRATSPHWSVVICKAPIAIEWAFFRLYRTYIDCFRAITLSPSSFAMRYISAPRRCRSTIEQVSKPFLRAGTHSAVKLRHIQMDCRVGGSRPGGEPCVLSYITHLSGRIYRAYIQGFRAIALSCVSFAE